MKKTSLIVFSRVSSICFICPIVAFSFSRCQTRMIHILHLLRYVSKSPMTYAAVNDVGSADVYKAETEKELIVLRNRREE